MSLFWQHLQQASYKFSQLLKEAYQMIVTYKFLSQLALETSLKLRHNATVQMVYRRKHRHGNDFSVGGAKIE